ncbi:MAG: pyridoxal phosphate-dependent aminotransferase [Bacteroidota bacterium]
MIVLADRLNKIVESNTLRMAKLSRELQAQGKDIINLSLGEPDFQTPIHIKEAAKKAIDDGYTFYTPVAGYLDLRQAISEKFQRENGLTYATDQIVVSTGAKHSIMNVMMALLNKDDEVIIPTPFWVSYSEMVKLNDGKPVYVHSTVDQDYKPTPALIEAAITDKTKIFIFSSPCNPTGSVFSKDELYNIAKVFEKYPQVSIIADEIYEHINFKGKHESIGQFDFIKDRVITVNGMSKGFAMTGWRLGYIGAPKLIAQACEKLQGQFTSGTNAIAQRAALAALQHDLKPTVAMTEAFQRRRDLVLGLMKDIPGFKVNVPEGAFYVFPDVSSLYGKSDGTTVINNCEDLCMYILHNANVALVGGDSFGAPECIRFSYATSDDKLVEALKRIKEAITKLK